MLVEKYEAQTPGSVYSGQSASTNDHSSGRYSVTKLPRISHTPSGHTFNSNTELVPTTRQAFSIPNIEKISTSGMENPVGRGPKIYTRNLPEVFTSGSMGYRPKKNAGMKERNKGDYGEQMSIQVGTPNNQFYIKKKANMLVSPGRLDHIPTTKGTKRIGRTDLYPPSMKENIESLAMRFNNVSPGRFLRSNTNDSYQMSPSRRSNNVRIKTNIDSGINFNNYASAKNVDSKEDDVKRQIKKLIVFKKKAANTSESKFFETNNDEIKVKLIDKMSAINPVPMLQLNELITIKKVKNSSRNGVIKRMLHAPSFKIFDVLEESIADIGPRENYDVKGYLNAWKSNFSRSKNVVRIYSCFWNSPEGCVSIVCESAKNGYLGDLLDLYGSLPEKSIQNVAKDVLTGIVEIQSKLFKPHGSINAREIIVDSNGVLKIAPGVSYKCANDSLLQINGPKSPRTIDENILKPSKFYQADVRSQTPSIHQPNNLSQDVFDLGFMLLQCALGDLSLYDPANSANAFNLENLKAILSDLYLPKKSDVCCLIHSEDFVRKIMTSTNSNRSNERKKLLNANVSRKRTKLLEDLENSFSSDISYVSLYEILTSTNRFSQNFIDFLCSCLKLNPDQRLNAEDLLDHEFFGEIHQCKGPQVSFQEFLGINSKGTSNVLRSVENTDDRELYKLGEALRVVFLNKHVKEKYEQMVRRSSKKEVDEMKVLELARELEVSSHKLKRKLNECLNNIQD